MPRHSSVNEPHQNKFARGGCPQRFFFNLRNLSLKRLKGPSRRILNYYFFLFLRSLSTHSDLSILFVFDAVGSLSAAPRLRSSSLAMVKTHSKTSGGRHKTLNISFKKKASKMFKFAWCYFFRAVTAPRDVACGGGRALPEKKRNSAPQPYPKRPFSKPQPPNAFCPGNSPRRRALRRGRKKEGSLLMRMYIDVHCVGCVCVFFLLFFFAGPGGSSRSGRLGVPRAARARARAHARRQAHTGMRTHTQASKRTHTRRAPS